MGSEWEILQLKDAGVTLIDCVHKTPPDAGKGVPYIAIPQMKEGRIDFSANPRLINNEHYIEWTKKAKPQHNDIILSRRCNPGETAYVPPEVEFVLGQNLVLLRSDGSKVQPSFLRWLLSGPDWWEQVGKFLNAGAVFDSLKCAEIPKFELPIPPLPEQKAIAHVLGSLDDRIELNRRMDETLEAMAQALFKSWFVDFDPVIDNALAGGKEIPEELSEKAQVRAALGDKRRPLPEEIRTLFPDEFTYSCEMGWIPKGWQLKTVSAFAEKLSKGTTPRKADIANAQDAPDVPFLKVKNIDEKGIIKIETIELIPRSVHEGSLKRSMLKEGDILFSIAGTIGRTTIVPIELHDANANQALAFVRPRKKNKTYFLLQLLRSESIQNLVSSRIVQAVQANVSLTELGSLPVLDSGEPLINFYHEHIVGVYKKIFHVRTGSAHLIKLRDTLLPKLLSGEIRIPDAEKMVKELAL